MAGSLEKAIGDFLRKNGMTLSVAESCTGGLVSDRITSVSGSSDYFEGGIVSYSIQAKAEHLHIPRKYIEQYGAVSPQVAKRMAEGVRKAFQTTFGLSTTGVAGPTGGTRKTPVGTVFIGFSREGETLAKKLRLKGSRREIKEEAAERCLRVLSEQLAHLLTTSPTPHSRLCRKSVHGSTGSPRTDYSASKNTRLAVRPERVEGRVADHDTVSLPKGGRGEDSWLDCLSKSKESEIVIIRKAPRGISNQKGRLGIFPASFNPPTLAHIALVREAIKKKRLDEVLVLLDIQAMDKEPVEATFEDRLTMLKRVFGKDSKISIGLSNQGLFLEKLKPLRALYPTSVELVFIVGYDTILRVMDKKYYRNRRRSLDELFEQSHFLVANRGGLEREAFSRLLGKPGNRRYRNKVSFLTLSPKFSTLSSTQVRKKIARGQPVDEGVPASILPFLKEKGLYKTR